MLTVLIRQLSPDNLQHHQALLYNGLAFNGQWSCTTVQATEKERLF